MTDGEIAEVIDLWRSQPAPLDNRVSDYSNTRGREKKYMRY